MPVLDGMGVGTNPYFQARGDMLTLSNDEPVVEQGQGLQGGDGSPPHWGQLRCVGAVERLHKRIGKGPKDETVDAAAVVFSAVDIEAEVVDDGSDMNSWRLQELFYGRAPHQRIEFLRNGEHGVADFLGGQAASTDFLIREVERPVGGRCRYQAMD